MSTKLTTILVLTSVAVFVGSENVTTVFKLEASAENRDFGPYGTWRIVTRNGARGFPLRRGNIGISNVWAGQPCCQTWSHDGWTKLSQEEALLHKPPLEVDAFESSKPIPAEPTGEYNQDSEGVWRGTMALDSRARLAFVPPTSGRAVLAIYLCEFKEIRDDHCVSVLMTGSSTNGKNLRYRTKRTEYGSFGEGSTAMSSSHRNTYIVSENYDIREGWQTNYTYHFSIERTSYGDLEVELDGADPSQRRPISLRGQFTYNKIAVQTPMSGGSDIARKLRLAADSAWRMNLSPSENVKVSFSPNFNNTGHLGFALCKDRFREHCSAIVFDGIANGKLVRNDPAYWTAGFVDVDKPIPDSSKNARWGKSTFTLTLARDHEGTVIIAVDGDENNYTWSVPDNYTLLVVDTYRGEGTVSVNTDTEGTSASVWRLAREVGELRSPPIPEWYVAGDVCASIAARVGEGTEIVVSVQRFKDNKGSRVLETLKSEEGTQWIQKRITIPPSRILQKHKVQIVLTARQAAQTKYPVLVQWAAACNPDGHNDEVSLKGVFQTTLNDTVGFRSSEFTSGFLGIFGYSFNSKKHKVCQNDGLLSMDAKCLCRPGFTGRLCEKACGPNRFGEMCESKCSDELSLRECRGMWLCTPDLLCDCAPGLQGLLCDKPCEDGKYGVGCRQECGQCAYGTTCDPFSGVCRSGCAGPRLPPYCKTECGRLRKAAVPLIADGNITEDNLYPWHVGIYDQKFIPRGYNSTKGELICGGTMITPNVVISAAHCFWDERTRTPKTPDRYVAAFGKLKRGWDAKEKNPQEIQKRDVAAIHIPPDFHGIVDSKADDIALIELMTPVDLTPQVIPACFDQVGGYEEVLREGSIGYVAGWGLKEDNLPSDDLKVTGLAFITRKECLNAAVGPIRPYVLAKDRFCTGDSGGTTYVDRGDAGGGLLYPQLDNHFLRGVLSTGSKTDKTFAIYTNVSYLRDWIVDELQKAAIRKAFIESFLNMQH